MWYHEVVGDKRCPIVATWWQTETGGILITPLPGATALWGGNDENNATAAVAARTRVSAASRTSLWGSGGDNTGDSTARKTARPYSRTSLWGREDDASQVKQKKKQATARKTSLWGSDNSNSNNNGSNNSSSTAAAAAAAAVTAAAAPPADGNALRAELTSDLEQRFHGATEAFLAADVNRSGALDVSELIRLCRHFNLPPDHVEAAFNGCDIDRNGLINYAEFAARLQRASFPGAGSFSTAAAAPPAAAAAANVAVPASLDGAKRVIIRRMAEQGASEEEIFRELARYEASLAGGVPTQSAPQRAAAAASAPTSAHAQSAPVPRPRRPPTTYRNASSAMSGIFGGHDGAEAVAAPGRRMRAPRGVPAPVEPFQSARSKGVPNRNLNKTSLW